MRPPLHWWCGSQGSRGLQWKGRYISSESLETACLWESVKCCDVFWSSHGRDPTGSRFVAEEQVCDSGLWFYRDPVCIWSWVCFIFPLIYGLSSHCHKCYLSCSHRWGSSCSVPCSDHSFAPAHLMSHVAMSGSCQFHVLGMRYIVGREEQQVYYKNLCLYLFGIVK